MLWLLALAYFYPYSEKYSYREFLKHLQDQQVKEVTVNFGENNNSKLKTVSYTLEGKKATVIVNSSAEVL